SRRGPSDSASRTTAAAAQATIAVRRHIASVSPVETSTSGQPKKVLYSEGPTARPAADGPPASDRGEIAVKLVRSATKYQAGNGPWSVLCGPKNCTHSGYASRNTAMAAATASPPASVGSTRRAAPRSTNP